MNLAIVPQLKLKMFYPLTVSPLSGGYVYTVLPGTSAAFGVTPASPMITYTNSAGSAQNSNPIVLNGSGEADVWLQGFTKFVVYDSTGNLVASVDNVSSVPYQGVISQWVVCQVPPVYASATEFSLLGDHTILFAVRTRVRASVTAGYIYGTVYAVALTAGYTIVDVAWDSTQLDNSVSEVASGFITVQNTSIPKLGSGPEGTVCVQSAGVYAVSPGQLNSMFSISAANVTVVMPAATINVAGSWAWFSNKGGPTFAISPQGFPTTPYSGFLQPLTVASGELAFIFNDSTHWWGRRVDHNYKQMRSRTCITTAGASTYTPAFVFDYILVRAVGGGGGGGGSGAGSANGGDGGDTIFGGTLTAGKGAGVGTGGTTTDGDVNIGGGTGGASAGTYGVTSGGYGGGTPFGGAGAGGAANGGGGQDGITNTGGGGGGGGGGAGVNAANGGGGGAYLEKIISTLAASYVVTVGAAGAAGAGGAGGAAGGAGGTGLVIIDEFYTI